MQLKWVVAQTEMEGVEDASLIEATTSFGNYSVSLSAHSNDAPALIKIYDLSLDCIVVYDRLVFGLDVAMAKVLMFAIGAIEKDE